MQNSIKIFRSSKSFKITQRHFERLVQQCPFITTTRRSHERVLLYSLHPLRPLQVATVEKVIVVISGLQYLKIFTNCPEADPNIAIADPSNLNEDPKSTLTGPEQPK